MVGLNEDVSMSKLKVLIKAGIWDQFALRNPIHVERWEVRFLCLDQGKVDLLEVPFSEEEIKRKLMSADGNKAPGPNGFPFKFT